MFNSKRGINVKDGFYLAMNPKTQKISVISVSRDTVYIHKIEKKLSVTDLAMLDKTNLLDIFAELNLKKKKPTPG